MTLLTDEVDAFQDPAVYRDVKGILRFLVKRMKDAGFEQDDFMAAADAAGRETFS